MQNGAERNEMAKDLFLAQFPFDTRSQQQKMVLYSLMARDSRCAMIKIPYYAFICGELTITIPSNPMR